MAIQSSCPQCGKVYRFSDNYAGRQVPCRECGAAIVVGVGEVGMRAAPVRSAPPLSTMPAPQAVAEFEPEDDAFSHRPRRRASKGNGLFWGLLAGGFGLVVVLAVVVLVLVLRPGANGRATPENFQRIQQGMTENQTLEIMGPATQSLDLGFVRTLTWSAPPQEFVVTLMNDRVTMMVALNKNGNGPLVANAGGNKVPFNPNIPNFNPPQMNVPNPFGVRDWTQLKIGMTEKELIDKFGPPALQMKDLFGVHLIHAGVTEAEVRAAHNGQALPAKVFTYMDFQGGPMQHKITLVDSKVFKIRKL